MRDLTFLLPAYNEEKSIGLVIDEIRRISEEPKILVGDNGSTDKTKEIVVDKGIEPVWVNEKGKANVISELIKRIETPYVIMLNSDHTYPAVFSKTIYNLLKMDNYDVILGYRDLREADSISSLNSFGNWGLSLLASASYGKRVYDVCTGMWGFKTEVLKSFSIDRGGYVLEADLWSNACKSGCKIGQIPIVYRKRVDGTKSGLRLLDGLKIGWTLVRKAW